MDKFYVITYSPGESYDLNKTVYEQDLLEHGIYMQALIESNHLILAGPFIDNPGGLLLLKARDENEVYEIINKDPAIVKNILAFKMNAWHIRFGKLNL